jgi:ABC-type transport system involved in cytochrome bd biosynthesis fused ATPase/permease subunit
MIVVFQEGEIVERGSHDDLLSRGGVYSSMWNQQQQSLDTTNLDSAHEQEVGGASVKKTVL